MRKCKEGDEEKQTLDTRIYLVITVGIKPPLVHVVEKLNKSTTSQPPSLFRGPLDLPQWLTPSPLVTLIPLSTKELLQKGWGLHIPFIRSSMPLHTKPKSRRHVGESPRLQRPAHYTSLVHCRTYTQGITPCSFSLSHELKYR